MVLRQILPLLIGGVLAAGFLLGRPGHEALVPSEWIAAAVGGDSPHGSAATRIASAAGGKKHTQKKSDGPVMSRHWNIPTVSLECMRP